MIAVVAAIVASVAAGVWAERRYGEPAAKGSRRGLLFVLYVVLPPTTFFNIAAADIDVDDGVGLALGYAALGVVAVLAWWAASRVLGLSRPATGSVVVCALLANTAYLGYPVVAFLEGLPSLSDAVVYDILVAQPVLLLGAFSIGAAFGDRAGEGGRERAIAFLARNPPLYAAILGLLAPDSFAPDVAVDISRVAIVAVLPIGFFAVGTALAEESEHGVFAGIPRFDAPVAVAVGLRMVIAPLLMLVAAALVIDMPTPYLVLAAMPVGVNSMVVTHTYGLDLRISAASVAWSTAIAAVALIPLSLLL